PDSHPARGIHLRLQFDNRERLMDERHFSITIGRAEDNDVVVKGDLISRVHARIEISHNRVIMLLDQSTNGTFVQTADGDELFVRRGSGNRARWALPPEAVYEHSWLEPLSIFRFLARLAGSECLQHPALIDLWAVDLASAALAVRTLVESAGLRRPLHATIRMGLSGGMHLIATTTFSAPRS